ncbi:MAG: DUF1549 and DUF1553 domain-containing protein [Gemmataceae bacterium]
MTRWGFFVAVAAGLIPAIAQARPAHKRALADYFGPFLAKKLNDCQTCHVPDKPRDAKPFTEAKDKPHNVFGARLKAVKKELDKAGKKSDIVSRIEAIAEEDSDGDGVANLLEILTGHFPGDPADKPSAEEVAAANKTVADFLKYRSGYPWRPLQVVHRPAVPQVKNASWVRNPIDAFIAADHEERGLKPRPEAPKAILLRRVYLDLIGLPPTPEELHAFLTDSSTDAYDRVVERLLASPRYGERWGRHWMDIWRYSDWAGWGEEVRDSQRHIWHWRDWIIESLNEDKGYDRMILEMLAGDEIAPENDKVVRATGYLVRNYKRYSREKWLQDTVDHTFQAFLGTTLGCARCHDHMYDPFLQKEYYQVRAVFEPYNVRVDRVPGQPDINRDGLARAYDATPEVKTFMFIRGDERTPDQTALEPGVPEASGGRLPETRSVKLPKGVVIPGKREFVEQEDLAASAEEVKKAQASLKANRLKVAQSIAEAIVGQPLPIMARLASPQDSFNAMFLAEAASTLAEARHSSLVAVLGAEHLEDAGKKDTVEGQAAALGATAAQRSVAFYEAKYNVLVAREALKRTSPPMRPEAMKKAADAQTALAAAEVGLGQQPSTAYVSRPVPIYPAISTGRRLAFAKWLADRENPLTARVAMNHIWLRHFGQAIVPSVFDFGRNGRHPSHPALLDWMAAELVERKWSMKAMHRLIVTSSTYRMASTPDSANAAIDRDNKYLWRMPPHRIEAEVVRDSVFYVAGKLDLTTGGPDIDQKLGLTVPRRSLYFRHAAEKQMEFLKIFDSADVYECYRRKSSVMPQQALALINSELTLKYARLLARSMAASKNADDDSQFTTAAFERVLSRPPTPQEQAECVLFLKERTSDYQKEKPQQAAASDLEGQQPASDPALRAKENLVHVLLNHHDFVTIR